MATLDAEDLTAIAAAVWNHAETNAATGKSQRFGDYMAWMDRERAAQTAAIKADLTTIASIGGPSAAQITDAVQAGLTAAVAHLATSLSAAPKETS